MAHLREGLSTITNADVMPSFSNCIDSLTFLDSQSRRACRKRLYTSNEVVRLFSNRDIDSYSDSELDSSTTDSDSDSELNN